jgi:HrpA-like RNA helicase
MEILARRGMATLLPFYDFNAGYQINRGLSPIPQVTQDLNSFWQTTYHEVKKELRGKYKRHYWPDDPFNAQATSKTKNQMNR